MSILYRPPSINTSVDPGLQYVTQREQQQIASNTNAAGDNQPSIVFEQINNVVTNIVRNDPSDTVLDLVELNLTAVVNIDSNVTATILTGSPIDTDRTVRMAPASTMTGRRLIIINRSQFQHLIVQDSSLNTIVVVQAQTSEEILSDGYSWIAVN